MHRYFIYNESTGNIKENIQTKDPTQIVVPEGLTLVEAGELSRGEPYDARSFFTSFNSHKIINSKITLDENWKSQEDIEGDPFNMLRGQRNGRLGATDWRASSDLTLSAEWVDYRQALRDLPANSTPVNENGILTGIDWPEEPE